ncbi:hypothetical protein [Erythrobacter sp.]|uniref:hypothetical protein n=1 Tax=Sphingomonadales TaxID=204457 RepID=UPI0032660780
MLDAILIDYRGQIQDGVLIAVCVGAFIWGGGPEKFVAATWLVIFEGLAWAKNWMIGDSVQLSDVDWFLASLDVLAGAVFVGIALYANRNYTMWIAAMQVLAVMAHLARGVADLIAPIAYAIMFIVPGWLQLFLLGAGLMRHILRKRKHGPYRDWRTVSPNAAIARRFAPLLGENKLRQAKQPSWRDDLK